MNGKTSIMVPNNKTDPNKNVNVKRHLICHTSPRSFMNGQKTKGKTILLLVDCQHDFCDITGSLFVPGAEEDMERVANFIKINGKNIDEIYATMDTHHRNHIAHAVFWKHKISGNEPELFHQIKEEEVGKIWVPKDPSLLEHCKYYTHALKSEVQKCLTIWPEHCLVGTNGHALYDKINDALEEWTSDRFDRDIQFVHKGMNCLTEMYSAIKADVELKTDPQTQENVALLDELEVAGLDENSKLIICGEASSHCVNCTARDIIADWLMKSGQGTDKAAFERWKFRTGKETLNLNFKNIIILSDGCSPVSGYEEDSEQLKKFCRKNKAQVIEIAELQHYDDVFHQNLFYSQKDKKTLTLPICAVGCKYCLERGKMKLAAAMNIEG